MGRHHGYRLRWLLMGLLQVSTVWGADPVPAAYRAVAADRNIPPAIFYAMALTESGTRVPGTGAYRPWPWTLNIAGRGQVFATRQAAWQALTASLGAGERSIDIGLMQVNWRYHRDRLGSPWQALDPFHNLRVGADILQSCYEDTQDWWASVGCYHAPNHAERAAHYRRRVDTRWRQVLRGG